MMRLFSKHLLAQGALYLIRLVGALPLGVRARCGAVLGRIFSLIPSRDRKIAELQLQVCLGVEAKRYLAGSYANLGRNILESINLNPLILRRDTLFRDRNPELSTQMQTTTRPIVALTAHFGNWDLLAALMVARGFRLSVIGREARNPVLQEVLADIRARAGMHTIWRGEGTQGLREIVDALRAGAVVAALIDQDTRVSGQFLPFFGMPAHTPSALLDLAKRFNAHVVAVVLRRELVNGIWGGEIVAEALNDKDSPADILRAYHEFLEKVIRADPEQWVWLHKRWRTLPSGERLSSREYVSALTERLTT